MRITTTDGLVLVDKPAGVTSHDVVMVARRALGQRRIGHAGTLDPFATGLLVLLVGRATRLLPYLDAEPKVYDVTIRFGAETDTDDATGTVIRSAPLPDEGALDAAIHALTGEIEQRPPAYSAKQVNGQRAHAAARRGAPLELPPSRVTVHAWSDLEMAGDTLHCRITCSGGTYVRALARDLGRLAGSAAHAASLRRVQSGAFTVAHAASLDALRAGEVRVHPPRDAVASLPVEMLDPESLARVRHGMAVTASVEGVRAALVDDAGALVAVADRAGAEWRPRLVLAGD
ncbi:MAG TPA: tRNA pseudouridine(55) synthase TruB [Gemmatimonadaceae bacterium]|nr:tRNA pseudouridine(55) synthase TruB [Gemmatimonadaceae bacterium]